MDLNDLWIILALAGLGVRLIMSFRPKNDDWLAKAQERQRRRNEYNDPKGNWAYNKNSRMWVDPEQMDFSKHQTANDLVRENWNKQAWKAQEDEKKINWEWDEEKQIWADADKKRRLARYREYHKNRPPTFEEWKAQREAELAKENEKHPE